jgi:hypothetical protein
LTGHPQNPFQLFLALGGKIHIYDILPNHGKGKDLLSHVMALPGIPKVHYLAAWHLYRKALFSIAVFGRLRLDKFKVGL